MVLLHVRKAAEGDISCLRIQHRRAAEGEGTASRVAEEDSRRFGGFHLVGVAQWTEDTHFVVVIALFCFCIFLCVEQAAYLTSFGYGGYEDSYHMLGEGVLTVSIF